MPTLPSNQVNWITNEDAALKFKLQGLTVQDANNPARPVPVRYRLPEDELATLTYPIIIIEHIGLFPAPEREHRGYGQLGYAPDGFAPWWAQAGPLGIPLTEFDVNACPYYSYYPLPYNFDYQITIYCRKMPGHLQVLMATLATEDYLPYHMGFLNIPQDGTIRKLFLLGGPEIEYGKDQDDKRLLRAIYRVRVESEVIPHVDVFGPYNALANQFDVDLGVYGDLTDIGTEEIAENFGIISTGPTIQWDVTPETAPPGEVPDGSLQPLTSETHRRPKTGRAVTPRSNTK